MKQRVVVTGMGVVSPAGNNLTSFWNNLVKGVSSIKKISRFNCTDMPTQIAGEVQDFEGRYIETKEARRLDRFVQFAVDASYQAVNQARVDFSKEDPYRTNIYVGTATAGQGWALEQGLIFEGKGYRKMNPFTAAATFPNAASSNISIQFGVKGRCDTISSGCVSGLNAISYGYDAIRNLDADICIAGGSEALLYAPIFGSYLAARVTSTKNSFPLKTPAPFDMDRDGIVLSEGAGIIILESLEHALERGAQIYAEILGIGQTSDAYKMIARDPTGEGITEAILTALKKSNLRSEDVDYVHMHGMGDRLVDAIETLALKRALGAHAYKIKTSSIKSMIGHTQGACGAIEVVATILSLQNNTVLPTINLLTPDPDCDLDYTPNQSFKTSIKTALVNTVGFGGKNTSIAIKKYEQ